MRSNSLHELKENARLYKSELMKIMFDACDIKPYSAPNVGGQAFISAEATNLMAIPLHHNILGIGYGMKESNGAISNGEEVIRVYVRSKLAKNKLSIKDLVPAHINGLPTDIIAVGNFICYRPVLCGVSVGHIKITAGTLGCVVQKSGGGAKYILSNNHVLANSNNAKIGDAIVEPGPADGGSKPIAELAEFEPLSFSNANSYDAAIARIIDVADVNPEILSIGKISSTTQVASLNTSVMKTGRTTKHTVGKVKDISADVRVNYGSQLFAFVDQLSIEGDDGAFGAPGDSGALIVSSDTKEPIALLFGGGAGEILASPIDQILDRFGVNIFA